MDVHRILEVKDLDRNRHPFAKRQHCFTVKTIHSSYLFEAGSTVERDRIIRGLKLVIARLATKLIVADPSLADEFFLLTPSHCPGPGEEPLWFENQAFL
jgi:hypothetical protein